MIEERAIVVSDAIDNIQIEVQRQSACGQCAASKGCGTSVLQKVMGNRRTQLQALSNVPVSTGDEVIVGLGEDAFLKGSFAVYLVPLILVFVFAGLGQTLGEQLFNDAGETLSIIFALAGGVAGAVWLRRFNAAVKIDSRYQPVILRLAGSVPDQQNVVLS